jgi:hypothetical protein
MKHIHSMTASAAMIAAFLAPAYGAPKPNPQSPATEAQAIFEQIDEQAAAISDTASNLSNPANREQDRTLQVEGLDGLKDGINRIGNEIQVLEAERASLSEWEGKTLDEVVRLMHDVADNAQKAILTFKDGRTGFLAHSYFDETAKVSSESRTAADLLSNKLKVAKTLEQEERIEQRLGQSLGL